MRLRRRKGLSPQGLLHLKRPCNLLPEPGRYFRGKEEAVRDNAGEKPIKWRVVCRPTSTREKKLPPASTFPGECETVQTSEKLDPRYNQTGRRISRFYHSLGVLQATEEKNLFLPSLKEYVTRQTGAKKGS